VTSARRRPADKPAPSRRLRRIALGASAATILAASAVVVTIGADGPTAPVEAADAPTRSSATPAPAPATLDLSRAADQVERKAAVSRSAPRVTLRKKPHVVARKFMTSPLNLWRAPREKGRPLAVLSRGDKVAVTGAHRGAFAQILYRGQVRWVHGAYLADRMPRPKPHPTSAPKTQPKTQPTNRPTTQPRTRTQPKPHHRTRATAHSRSRSASRPARHAAVGVSTAPCPDGSSTESGLTPSAVTLYRAVCHAFPALSSYGGYDAHGEHSSGKAIDFMVGSSSLGQAVAEWARAHASRLNLYDVIWAQHIWTPARASEGWRLMPDRGSATANHFDHVHIAVN